MRVDMADAGRPKALTLDQVEEMTFLIDIR
jgi:hypothetical protein